MIEQPTRFQWPKHIVHLALAFHSGEEDSLDPLHDALVELGYPSQAYLHFCRSFPHHCIPGTYFEANGHSRCQVIWAILNDLPFADCISVDVHQLGSDNLPWRPDVEW